MKKIVKQLCLYFSLFVIIKSILSYFIPADSAFSDNYHYIKLARSFFLDQDFSIHGNLYYSRPPLYPIALSISYLFKDMTYVYLAMKVINSVISSLIIFPAFLLSKEFLSEKKALISAILISLIPSSFAFAPHIMSENLFYPLFLFSIYFIYKSFSENNYKYSILAGIFVVLSTLTKAYGIILVAVFILISLIQFFRKKSQPNPLPFLIINLLIIIVGIKLSETSLLLINIPSIGFYIEIILYICYIILATGIVFSITAIFSFKNILKNKKYLLFSLIAIFTFILMLIVYANHGYHNLFSWTDHRPVGRYIETILPLIFITGLIGLDSYEKNKKNFEKWFKKTILVFAPILIISAFLMTYPHFSLFPVNNMSLTWLGVLKYIFEYIFYNKMNFNLVSPLIFVILLSIIFLLILIFIFISKNKLSFTKITSIFIILFLLVSLLNYGVTYYNSKEYWYEGEQMQLGLWLNKYDKGSSLIIIDERDCTMGIRKLNQTSLCEPFGTNNNIMGIWLNNDIKVTNVLNPPKNSIIISRHNLNFEKIKETENGIFVYKT